MTAVPSTPPPVAEEALPRTFGRYTLFELVGKGGMAQIYLARAETELGATRLAVVKQILPAFASDPRFAEMLIHEAKLAARLSHKHIVQVLDLGRSDGHLYIAMEYVEGFDLNALLRRCTLDQVGLPVEHALGIVADVLEGLDYAHRRIDDEGAPLGIVHRDVSPSNVLVSYEGEVKLCDFGIAHANDLVQQEATEALKGKAGYMSPEHARGDAIDARADVFAAGIILWELLAGRRLYSTKSELSLIEQARRAEIPALPDKGIVNGADLERIVRRALAREPEERYPSAAAFGRDLEGYLAESGLLASRLKLGEWIASSFGTALVEQRRASERRLPKSAPPPRSSERLRSGTSAASSVQIPSAPPVPADLAIHEAPPPEPPSALDFVSDGAMRAFKKELEGAAPPPVTIEAGSLAGASMDVADSSRDAVDPAATGRASSPAAGEITGPLASPKRTLALVVLIAVLLAFVAISRHLVR
jgi:eukaryotic-like serine/threonine-protein kinase